MNISCSASGYPIPTLHFLKDQGFNKPGNYVVVDNDALTVTSSLVIDGVTPEDAGEYFCVASNLIEPEAIESILELVVYCKRTKRS